MVITEPNCCKHFFYYAIHWVPVITFLATIALSILWKGVWWLLAVGTGIFALIWCNAIMVWMHRCGLDLALFGLDLLVDTDRAFNYLCIQNPIPVTSCVKIDKPDNMDEFRQFVHSHFMGFRRCRSTIVRIWNDYFYKVEKRADVLESMVVIHDEPMDDDEVHAFQAKEHSLYHETD